ncbi:MAG: FtsQ-type POTRA domain-containing protein [Clostridia bacterium]|nr:FtsQ-type POTRA domain-containing protein [Clostridia bacterium]
MKERLQALRDALLERIPRRNYSPAEKAALIKRTAIIGCVLGVLALLLLTISLFPVTDVEIVDNGSHYSEQQLLEALDTAGWTPVLRILPRRAEQRLLDKLLYLESAEVSYVFPSTLRVSVKEQTPLYYFHYDTLIGGKSHTGWLAVGPDLRVVDAARDAEAFAAQGLTKIALPAPVLDQTKPGRNSMLQFTREDETGENAKTEQDFAYISEFLGWLEQSSVADRLTAVDLREKFDVKITLENKYLIEFRRVRDERDFAQKLALAEQILAESDIDPEGKYIVFVGNDEPLLSPAGERDVDTTG